MWDKIDLENLIFIQAEKEHKKIFSKKGILLAKGPSKLLAYFLQVYNSIFRESNEVFLLDDLVQEHQSYVSFYLSYRCDAERYPLDKNAFEDNHYILFYPASDDNEGKEIYETPRAYARGIFCLKSQLCLILSAINQ